jgi:hypothetical protein
MATKNIDNHLLSFDDEYRMALSRKISARFSERTIKDYFERYEGQALRAPKTQPPLLKLLAEHRRKVN